MKEKSIEEIEAEIIRKKTADKKKLKFLAMLAISGLATRLLLYTIPIEINGLWVEILWIPAALFGFAYPFTVLKGYLTTLKKTKSLRNVNFS